MAEPKEVAMEIPAEAVAVDVQRMDRGSSMTRAAAGAAAKKLAVPVGDLDRLAGCYVCYCVGCSVPIGCARLGHRFIASQAADGTPDLDNKLPCLCLCPGCLLGLPGCWSASGVVWEDDRRVAGWIFRGGGNSTTYGFDDSSNQITEYGQMILVDNANDSPSYACFCNSPSNKTVGDAETACCFCKAT